MEQLETIHILLDCEYSHELEIETEKLLASKFLLARITLNKKEVCLPEYMGGESGISIQTWENWLERHNLNKDLVVE